MVVISPARLLVTKANKEVRGIAGRDFQEVSVATLVYSGRPHRLVTEDEIRL